MLKDRITMLIFSCDKFSDLWDGHIQQLETYWPRREMSTYLITDKPSKKQYDHVTIISAGEGKEFSERLEYALNCIQTEYVLVTLDDYFLIKPVSNERIYGLLNIMQQEELDYLRLFLRPKRANGERLKRYKGIRKIRNNYRYSINLYTGIWRRDFMQKTVREVKNPWQYEVSLYKIGTELDANCAMSCNKEFVILDVVRKGKILNKANRYFKRHDIYHGNREVQTYWYEFKLGIRTLGVRLAPSWMTNIARNFMIKRGHHYYSQEE